MQRLRPILALFVAALWLAATQHCGLEAAGVLAQHCEQGSGSNSRGCAGSDCAVDGCKTVEDGSYRSSTAVVKIAPPVSTVCACLICIRAAVANLQFEPIVRAAEFSRPLDWVASWQFERRAALPPGAPSVSFA